MTGDTYCAGLWLGDIGRGLLWSRQTPIKETLSYLAPSWSWASKISAVDNGLDPYFMMENARAVEGTSLDVLDVRVEPSTADPFGRLSGGRLRVRAWTWNAFLDSAGSDSESIQEGAGTGPFGYCDRARRRRSGHRIRSHRTAPWG